MNKLTEKIAARYNLSKDDATKTKNALLDMAATLLMYPTTWTPSYNMFISKSNTLLACGSCVGSGLPNITVTLHTKAKTPQGLAVAIFKIISKFEDKSNEFLQNWQVDEVA